ncbi:MAG: YhbY family RNA-binding protein [Bacilli bacterium]|jgi:RNA-binding protein
MLTNKQKKYLKGEAHHISAQYQIGKNLIGPTQIDLFDKALTARELIKISVQKSAVNDMEQIIEHLTSVLNAELIDLRGHIITLYRQNKLNPRYTLPK